MLADPTADSNRAHGSPSMINGRRGPALIELVAGTTHRLRFISIAALSLKQVRLLESDMVLRWMPVAKDGAEFAAARGRSRRRTRC